MMATIVVDDQGRRQRRGRPVARAGPPSAMIAA
jgi:hypothetical protein